MNYFFNGQTLAVRTLFTLYIVFAFQPLFAQKVGIGTNNPRQYLSISAASDSALLLLENRQPLNIGTVVSQYFKNGSYYTGAVKTVGYGTASSRLAFFTYADADSSKLKERMSILDNGNVGIGTSTPQEQLEVVGRGKFTTAGSSDAAVTGINSGINDFSFAGVRGLSDMMGVQGQAFNQFGIGVQGINLSGGGAPSYPSGVGVVGFSNAGHGVFGRSTKSGAAGVLGSAYGNGAYGGYFDWGFADGFQNTLALRTVGSIRMTAIGEGNGKVLTSDASGNATWQPLPQTGTGFSAYLTANTTVNNSAGYLALTGFTEEWDEGNNFSNGTGTFTAPAAGSYMFTFKLSLSVPASSAATMVNISISQNVAFTAGSIHSVYIEPQSSQKTHSIFFSKLVKMNINDTVTFRTQIDRAGATTHSIAGNSQGVSTLVSGIRIN